MGNQPCVPQTTDAPLKLCAGPRAAMADSLDEAKAAGRRSVGAGALTDGAPGRGRPASAFARKSGREMLLPEPIGS